VGDESLTLAALLHDVGKPPTRQFDDEGNIRFFGHESVGAEMAQTILRRLKIPQREIDTVVRLVRNHMRLGSAPVFTASAARRLIRDLDEDVERLVRLVEADASSLRPGVRVMDLDPIRARIAEVAEDTPRERLESPLSGAEIMALRNLSPGPEVGRLKNALTEMVLEGTLRPDDVEGARRELERLP
jgi:putative nucleotidyltransferase with HDIG domain